MSKDKNSELKPRVEALEEQMKKQMHTENPVHTVHFHVILGVVLAVIGLIGGAIIGYFIELHFHERLTTAIGKQAAPLYAETYPHRTRAFANYVAPELTQNGQLVAMLDFIGFEHYSSPKDYELYVNSLIEAHNKKGVEIRVLVDGPNGAKEALENQFNYRWFQKKSDGKYAYYDLVDVNKSDDRTDHIYDDYIQYYTKMGWIDKDDLPTTYEQFINLLLKTQSRWCGRLDGIIKIKTIPYKLVKQPIHFWMIPGKKILFTFPAWASPGPREIGRAHV
jgi:hypothetical protein